MLNVKFSYVLKREVYLHIFFWLFYICYPLLKYFDDKYVTAQFLANNSNIVLVFLFVYVCYLYIFPFKIRNKIIVLIIFIVLMTVFGVITSKVILKLLIYQINNYSYLIHALGILGEYLFVGLLFFCFYTIKRNYFLEKENNKAELSSLRSQINPHFLFNTLNSIYSYSLEGDNPKASLLILKLSDNFKYVLYKGQTTKVTVNEDLNHIKDYIELQKLRWQDKIEFKLNDKIDNKDLKITPLIIITFVENAVKYTSKLKGKYHCIKVDYIISNNTLKFKCINQFDKSYLLSNLWKESGIGLINTKRRLDLLYNNKYTLDIKKTDTEFKIDLTIEL